jgi:outer membrane protein assembly factor BamB
VVAVVLGAGALDSWRESTALAQVAESPASLDPIDGPLRELWRTEDLFLNGFDRVGGLLVGSGYRSGGAVDAVGLDPATGAEVWTTPLSPDGRETGGAQCVTPDPAAGRADAAVTVCVVVDETGPTDDAALTGAMQPSVSRFVVLDSATGRVLSEEPTAPGTSLAVLGADVVFGSLDDAGRLQVRRTDARGERVRWEFTSPEPLGASDYGRWAWVDVVDGLVVAGGEAGWVLSAEGRPLHSWEPPPHGGGWVDLVGHGLLVQQSRGDPSTWEVVDVRTSASFEIDGHPAFTPVDDGSAGDILLTQAPAGGLAAYDVTDGRRRWSAPESRADGGAQLIVDGRVVQAQYDGIGALDATTGAPLWTTPLIPVPQFTLVTDGQLVLCVAVRDAPDQVLAAYGLDDGRLRWEVDLPEGLDYLFAVDGSLYGYARSGLVAFG